MSLRQVCDWCRLLWTYRGKVDAALLEERVRKAGLMGEWKTFAVIAVRHLGIRVEAMPFYDSEECWQKKGKRVLDFILKDSKSNKIKDTMAIALFFPWNTLRFIPSIIFEINGLKIKERIVGK